MQLPIDQAATPSVRALADIYLELGHTLLAHGRAVGEAGHKKQARRRFAAAADAFRMATQERPDDPTAFVGLAEANEAGGRRAEAVGSYVEAVQLMPDLAATVLARATNLLTPDLAASLGDVEGRWRAAGIDQAELTGSARTAVASFLGQLAFARADYDDAVRLLGRAVEAEPDAPAAPDALAAQESLGKAQWRSGDVEAAERTLRTARDLAEQATDQEPSASIHLALGNLLLEQDRYAEARDVFGEAPLDAGRLAPEAAFGLAHSYQGLGQSEEALSAAEIVLSHDDLPTGVRVEATAIRAAALYDAQHYDEAAAAAAAALALDPRHVQAIRVRAQALLAAGTDVEQALRLLQLYILDKPTDLERHRLLLHALRVSGQPPDRIIEAMSRLLSLVPPDEQPQLHLDLAEEYLRAGDVGQASEALEAAGEPSAERSARWWRLRGDIARATDDVSEAKASYEQAWRLDPRNAELLRNYGDLLEQHGETRKAAEAWRMMARVAPHDPDARLRLAMALYRLPDLPGALQAATDALALTDEDRLTATAAELRGTVLEQLGRAGKDVGNAFYQAGRSYFRLNDFEAAAGMLKRARRYRRDHLPTYWYLADCHLVLSWMDRPPYVKRPALRRALACWDLGAAIGPPERSFAWAYITRARISEEAARLSGDDWERAWEAVAFLERVILLDDSKARDWARLATQYRTADANANALLATEEALQRDQQQIEVLDERAAILINVGQDEEAESLVDRRRALESEPWADVLKSILLMRRKAYEEALDLLNGVVAIIPKHLWYHEVRALCLRRMKAASDARREYRWIWARRDDSAYANEASKFGRAAYNLATVLGSTPDHVLLDEATTIFRQLCDREQPDRDDLRMLGLCLLARGDRAGMEYLTTGIETEQLAPELDDVLHQFDELRQAAAAWDHRVMIEEALDRLTAQVEDHRSTLAEVRSPEHELEEILEGRERGDAARPAWPWLGAQAGLARLALAGGRLDQASDAYRRLAETACFPEAGQQLEQILGQLALRGDEALQLRRAEEAIDQYQHALDQYQHALELPSTAKGPGRRLPAVHAGLSLAYIDLGDMRRAQQHAREAVSLLGDLGEPDPGEALGRLMADQIGTTAHFWNADSGYAALVDLTHSDDPLRAQLSAARRALLTYLERAYRLQEEPHEAQLPVVTPIFMDLGPGLVPSDRGPDWSLFKHYLPDMREELRRRTGVTVPAVRVRQDDTLGQDGYAVLLDEAPAVGGSVQLGMRYCPADETLLARVGVSQADGVEAPDPRSGRPGRWLPPPHWDSVTAAGLELWSEPLQYAVHHLAAVLRDNLRQFLGLQEAETLLDEWAQTEEQQRLLETIRADQRGRLHAARVLRELAEEGVPLVAGDEVLDVLGHADLIGREVVDVVAEVRDRVGSATADGRAGGPGAVGHVTDDRRLP